MIVIMFCEEAQYVKLSQCENNCTAFTLINVYNNNDYHFIYRIDNHARGERMENKMHEESP